MFPQEEVPLWERVIHPLAHALEVAFGCRHRKLSRVFTVHGHSYKVGCECGATFLLLVGVNVDYTAEESVSPSEAFCGSSAIESSWHGEWRELKGSLLGR